MPDFIPFTGYTGVNVNQLTPKTVYAQVNNGIFAVARPTMTGTDRSIVASTTTQVLMPANASRMGFYIKNDTAIDVWFNIGASASAAAGSGNIKVPANGGYFESGTFTPGEVINIISASGSPAITAREF